MSTFQRIIKYMGMAFAICLTVVIIGGICAAVMGFGKWKKSNGANKENIDIKVHSDQYDYESFESIDLDCAAINVKVKIGSNYKVETYDVPEDMEIQVTDDRTLKIKSEHRGSNIFDWLDSDHWGKDSRIEITVPEDFHGEAIKVDTGAGNIEMNGFMTDNLKIDGGAGNVRIDKVIADHVSVGNGAGNLKMDKVQFGDVELDCGAGNVEFNGAARGDFKIDGGVGNVDLRIQGVRSDYNIDVDSGIGSIRIDGKKISELEEDNRAQYELSIDGGVGSVDVDFTDE